MSYTSYQETAQKIGNPLGDQQSRTNTLVKPFQCCVCESTFHFMRDCHKRNNKDIVAGQKNVVFHQGFPE